MALKKSRGSNKAKGLCKLTIDEEMTIYTIDMLKQGLSAEIDSYQRFELNLSNVEEIDSAGVQLLLALESELMRNNKALKLTAASRPVIDRFNAYGICEHFNIRDAT